MLQADDWYLLRTRFGGTADLGAYIAALSAHRRADLVSRQSARDAANVAAAPADQAAVQAWGERPDAFAAVMYCAALGWVDPAP